VHSRIERYRLPISLEVQIEGADWEMRVLREMHSEPEAGMYRPLVVSAEGE
jgi:hypothetical protein